MIPHNVKTIVFDLGGVIINLDPIKSFDALMQLSINLTMDYNELVKNHGEHFWQHERGHMNDHDFRHGLRSILNNQKLTDAQLDIAWNAMLLDIPLERIELLKELRTKYQLVVLSNTNQIHVDAFTKCLNENLKINGLEQLFDNIFYSHNTGFRKPEEGIFNKVTTELELLPEEVFFIDDNQDNIETAKKLGWQAHLLKANTLNPEYFYA